MLIQHFKYLKMNRKHFINDLGIIFFASIFIFILYLIGDLIGNIIYLISNGEHKLIINLTNPYGIIGGFIFILVVVSVSNIIIRIQNCLKGSWKKIDCDCYVCVKYDEII
jgi:hypothetical protein